MTTNAFSALAPLTARERWTLGAFCAVYAATVVVLRIHHGGDVVPEIALSERWLSGEPLYQSDLPFQGTRWPPLALVALVPFALIARASLAVAAAAWSVFGVACLGVAVALARRWGWKAAILALACTAVPLQTNFEHRNMNTVLLALVVAAAADLDEARETRAGLWLGLATALKVFPALLLVYLAVRGHWRALAVATAVAAGGTLLALAPYGAAGGSAAAGNWLRLSLDQTQWQLATSDQSLRALVLRLGGPLEAALGVAAVCLGASLIVARPLPGLGAMTLAAVLASPIAWVHYYVLAFPAWLAVLQRVDDRKGGGGLGGRGVALAFAAAATSGWLTVGPRPLRALLLGGSIYAWGGLVLLALVVARAFERTTIGARAPR